MEYLHHAAPRHRLRWAVRSDAVEQSWPFDQHQEARRPFHTELSVEESRRLRSVLSLLKKAKRWLLHSSANPHRLHLGRVLGKSSFVARCQAAATPTAGPRMRQPPHPPLSLSSLILSAS